ncbi:RDD family protein [Corynebacterium tapiri]|uniref:RDD family protein n=1 Tax=Corynebacterium tapiri TaxID=1448266 RepID=A0A5C4U7G6_9CORY|nr:RDD family protein [Corynebacterium tapiri]TNL99441.1 RDD family protein [Corynebacterium tapiri]
MAQPNRSWLDGPEIPAENDGPDNISRWPGENLGLPQSGPRSMASVGRRAIAVFIDWFICQFIAGAIHSFTSSLGDTMTLTLILWVILGIIGGWLFARTPGMALLGMGVARIDVPGARVGLWRSVVRTLLTMFVFPAAMVDADGRGMHDRGTGTAVIRG